MCLQSRRPAKPFWFSNSGVLTQRHLFCDACSDVRLVFRIVDSRALQFRRCPYLEDCDCCSCKRSIVALTPLTSFAIAQERPLGSFCVVRKGLTSRSFSLNTVKTAMSARAPECQSVQENPYRLNVRMKQVCHTRRTDVIAENGEADQRAVTLEAGANRGRRVSSNPGTAGTLALKKE